MLQRQNVKIHTFYTMMSNKVNKHFSELMQHETQLKKAAASDFFSKPSIQKNNNPDSFLLLKLKKLYLLIFLI